ncbi:MAG: hypothetical protein A4E30_00784 [Methanomassiliicoccales archaeon PtaB.Bin215]|nr:MAG: hypothetical protein A4E30_00784 [Methanomassiliicoccales archaeon PtaB.Bin215]
MEVGKLLSKWWFVALSSLAIGMPSAYLTFDLVFGGIVNLEGVTTSSSLLMTALLYFSLSGYYVLFICLLLTLAPRHATVGNGFLSPEALLSNGHEVVVRKGSYDIRVAKYSVIRVYEEDGGFRCLPTSTGLWAIALLSLGPQFVMFAFPFLLNIHEKCWRSVKALTFEEKRPPVEAEKGIDDLIDDSLRRTYVLAREAVDIRKASFQDHALILVALSLLAWAVLVMLGAPVIVDHGSPWWLSLGTAAIAVVAVSCFHILRRRSSRLVSREEKWAERIYSAIGGKEGGTSPIAVLLDACLEVPRWLSLHRKGIWNRQPGKTLLTFVLLVAGSNGLMQYGSISWRFFLLSVVLLVLGISLFSWMVITARIETRDLRREWEDRLKEMGSLLEPEGRR